jgi:hypothetical protein
MLKFYISSDLKSSLRFNHNVAGLVTEPVASGNESQESVCIKQNPHYIYSLKSSRGASKSSAWNKK